MLLSVSRWTRGIGGVARLDIVESIEEMLELFEEARSLMAGLAAELRHNADKRQGLDEELRNTIEQQNAQLRTLIDDARATAAGG